MSTMQVKLKEAKALRSEGTPIAVIARKLLISEQTARNWTQGVEVRNDETILGESVVDRLQTLSSGENVLKAKLYAMALELVETANETEIAINPTGYNRIKGTLQDLTTYVKNSMPPEEIIKTQKMARNSLLALARVKAQAGQLSEAEKWYQAANEQWEVSGEQRREFQKLLKKEPFKANDILSWT